MSPSLPRAMLYNATRQWGTITVGPDEPMYSMYSMYSCEMPIGCLRSSLTYLSSQAIKQSSSQGILLWEIQKVCKRRTSAGWHGIAWGTACLAPRYPGYLHTLTYMYSCKLLSKGGRSMCTLVPLRGFCWMDPSVPMSWPSSSS